MFPLLLSSQLRTYMRVSMATMAEAGLRFCGLRRFTTNDDVLEVLLETETSAKTIEASFHNFTLALY